MASNPAYKRLPGRRYALFGFARNSLWLSDDHLLHVVSRGYSEEYKRFHYGEIQAIVMRQTSRGKMQGLVLAALSGLSGLLYLLGFQVWEWENFWLWLWGGITTFWTLLLLTEVMRGSTCACYLKTAVQVEALPSFHRVRRAMKAIRILKNRIDAVQGVLTDEDWHSLQQTLPVPEIEATPQKSTVPVPHRGRFHALLFSLLLIDGIRIVLTLFFHSLFLYVAGLLIFALSVFAVVGAVVQQRNTDLNGTARGIAWCSFAYLWLASAGWYLYSLFSSFSLPDAGLNYWELLRSISRQPPLDSVPLLTILSFSAFCSLLFGIAGSISLIRYYSRRR